VAIAAGGRLALSRLLATLKAIRTGYQIRPGTEAPGRALFSGADRCPEPGRPKHLRPAIK
jgi:hypothetical protein